MWVNLLTLQQEVIAYLETKTRFGYGNLYLSEVKSLRGDG